MSKWKRVTEDMPPEGTEVHLHTGTGVIGEPYWIDQNGRFVDENMVHPEDKGYIATHFFVVEDIPEPPRS